MAMIEVKNLKKSYGDVEALKGISFSVKEGEIFGLLGPNGAGKTTTVSILSGILAADEGEVSIAGMNISKQGKRIRRIMGVVPQEIAVYEELTARENLHFWGSLYGLDGRKVREEAERVLELVDLVDRADDPVRTYSGGMKRRLNLVIGFIHRPRVVLLDEPTLGIDPQARLRILDIIKEEVSAGTTIIYTTHYLDEAERICDRIAIIDAGRILSVGTLEELARVAGEEERITVAGRFSREEAATLLSDVRIEFLSDGECRFAVSRREQIGDVLEKFFASGIKVENIRIEEPSLESAFVKLTGRDIRDI